MDVSYDEQQVDTVVADLNRMKQGNRLSILHILTLTIHSPCQSDHQRYKVHLQEERREKYYRLHGRIRRAAYVVPPERYIFQ